MRELVSISPCKHPRYTHRVRYPGPGGKRLGKFFTNETEALLFAKKQKQEAGETGTSFGSLREEERTALTFWRSFVEASPNAPDLLQVLREYRTNWLASAASITVKEAIPIFLNHQAAEGSGDRHLATLKSRLGRFETEFEAALISSITTNKFSEWLDGLKGIRADKEGAKLTLITRHNFCRSIRSFFSFAVERGWTPQNPVPAQKRSKSRSARLAKKRAPEVMAPDQIQRFLSKVENMSASLVPFWALKFFAGIRDAEAARMNWEMIQIKQLEIHLPANITKTGEQRTVKIEPNLVKWLTPYVQSTGSVAPKPMTRRYWFKRILVALSKENEGAAEKAFNFPSNAARHSFGTYHLYAFRDAGETALQLGHKGNPSMLHEHYKNPAAEKDANAFWQIFPA